jgi:hypothetical protein
VLGVTQKSWPGGLVSLSLKPTVTVPVSRVGSPCQDANPADCRPLSTPMG